MQPIDHTCFCGGSLSAAAANADYRVCNVCGSAVLRHTLVSPHLSLASDEAGHLYSKEYWDEHQAALGLPPIDVRSRLDLPERCTYWLGQMLRRSLPPRRLLEIGCSHGGFLKLAALAGFDALGLEMSPEIVRSSSERFGVDIRLGPVEEVANTIGKFDVIALFDVMEHVPDPRSMAAAIATLLNDDGIIIIQTPRHDAIEDPRWPMYLPPEHTFLYSSRGLASLLAAHGFVCIQYEIALASYDQFLFASRGPIAANSDETIAANLSQSPDSRVALAMLDLYQKERASARRSAPIPLFEAGPRLLIQAFARAVPRAVCRALGGMTKR